MCGAVLFSFPAAWLILTNVSCQNENSSHSDQEMALFEKILGEQGSISIPLVF